MQLRVVTATTEQAMVNFDARAAVATGARATSNTTLFQWIWPAAIIIFGAGLNIVWIAALGYGLVSLIRLLAQ